MRQTQRQRPEKPAKGARNGRERRPPFIMAFFGKQHSGKTHNAEEAVSESPKTVLVYNFGYEWDWKGYEVIKFIAPSSKEYAGTGKARFLYRGEAYYFEDFHRVFPKGSRVKMPQAFPRKEQTFFYNALLSVGDIVIVVDDATAAFSSTLSDGERALLATSKHHNIDVFLLAHTPRLFPPSAIPFLTGMRLFLTKSLPPKDRLDQFPNAEEYPIAFEELQQLPQYSYFTFDFNADKVYRYTHGQGTELLPNDYFL